ncbi:hypothetical protein Tco_0693607 [Tanacetum coccineum]
MMSQTRSTRGRENSAQPHLVTNDDLLTEILIRLPILCIHLFTTVSKQWLRILTSLDFTLSRSKIPNLDPLVVSREIEICRWEVEIVEFEEEWTGEMGEDVVEDIVSVLCYITVGTHNSNLLFRDRELEPVQRPLKHYKLNIEDHDHPIMTTLEIPHRMHRGRNFLESIGGGSDDLILLLMKIPHMLHLEEKFFESCGCLLFVCRNDIGSREFTIYEMMKGCSVWTVRYVVNTNEFITPLPERWSIQSTVWSIGLGEREKDVFIVINLSGKVVKYNLISKTINEIFDIGSNQMDDDDDDDVEFIPPFSVDPNIYEFIPSLASV